MTTLLLTLVSRASAQVFNGPGLEAGVNQASMIEGPLHGSVREIVMEVVYSILGYLALIGVVMVIIAGLFLMFSMGEDAAKDRAKKIILYTILGIIVVFFARSLVGFFLNGLP